MEKLVSKLTRQSGMLNFIKRHKWVFILSILTYVVWASVWLTLANVIFTDVSFFDVHFPSRLSPSDFTVSHAGSVLDSLVFFITVGLVLTLLSIKNPEEEKLDRKIEYIFNGADSESPLGQYLAREVSSLACISALTERIITFRDISDSKTAIKVSAVTDVQIKNIHNNHQYANDEMYYRIKADEVDCHNGIYGEVHDVSMIFDANQPQRNRKIIDCTQVICSASEPFQQMFDLKLKPQEQVIYRTNAWIWHSFAQPLNIVSPRFTERQIIELKNQSTQTLTLGATWPDTLSNSREISTKNIILKSGEVEKIELQNTTPDDKASFVISINEEKTDV